VTPLKPLTPEERRAEIFAQLFVDEWAASNRRLAEAEKELELAADALRRWLRGDLCDDENKER
jgi:hypothetical protein